MCTPNFFSDMVYKVEGKLKIRWSDEIKEIYEYSCRAVVIGDLWESILSSSAPIISLIMMMIMTLSSVLAGLAHEVPMTRKRAISKCFYQSFTLFETNTKYILVYDVECTDS